MEYIDFSLNTIEIKSPIPHIKIINKDGMFFNSSMLAFLLGVPEDDFKNAMLRFNAIEDENQSMIFTTPKDAALALSWINSKIKVISFLN